MLENVSAFRVYHASVAQRVLQEHFNIKEGMVFENLIQVEEEESEIKACNKLVEMFNRPGEWVLDANLPQGE